MDTHEVFGSKVTQKHDYTHLKLEEPKRYHTWSRDPKTAIKVLRQKPYRPLHINTMRPWIDPNTKVPFNLLWETKEIVRKHPKSLFGICPKPEDPLKQEVMKTRPRLYTPPAVSMDDISDANIRDLLTTSMYNTVFEQVTKELKLKVTEREIPNCTWEKSVDQTKGEYSLFKPIPVEARINGKAWEMKQYTTLVDPHRQYWLNYKHRYNTPVAIDQYKDTVSPEDRKEIRELVEKEELRLPYDKLNLYGGHVPRNVIGPFRKQELANK